MEQAFLLVLEIGGQINGWTHPLFKSPYADSNGM